MSLTKERLNFRVDQLNKIDQQYNSQEILPNAGIP